MGKAGMLFHLNWERHYSRCIKTLNLKVNNAYSRPAPPYEHQPHRNVR